MISVGSNSRPVSYAKEQTNYNKVGSNIICIMNFSISFILLPKLKNIPLIYDLMSINAPTVGLMQNWLVLASNKQTKQLNVHSSKLTFSSTCEVLPVRIFPLANSCLGDLHDSNFQKLASWYFSHSQIIKITWILQVCQHWFRALNVWWWRLAWGILHWGNENQWKTTG